MCCTSIQTAHPWLEVGSSQTCLLWSMTPLKNPFYFTFFHFFLVIVFIWLQNYLIQINVLAYFFITFLDGSTGQTGVVHRPSESTKSDDF